MNINDELNLQLPEGDAAPEQMPELPQAPRSFAPTFATPTGLSDMQTRAFDMPRPAPTMQDMLADDGAVSLAFAKLNNDRKQAVSASVSAVANNNPDEVAKAQQAGNKYGIAADIAMRNMDEIKRRLAVSKVEELDLVNNAPKLAQSMTDPSFAAVAHDDVQQLSWLERQVKSYGELAFALMQPGYGAVYFPAEAAKIGTAAYGGYAGSERNRLRYLDFPEVYLPGVGMMESPQPGGLTEYQRKELERLDAELDTPLPPEGFLPQAAEVLGQMAYQAKELDVKALLGWSTAGAAVGGPAGGLAAAGMYYRWHVFNQTRIQEAGGFYHDLMEIKDESGNPVVYKEDAALLAYQVGGIAGAIEASFLGPLVKPVGDIAKRALIKEVSRVAIEKIAEGAAKEAATVAATGSVGALAKQTVGGVARAVATNVAANVGKEILQEEAQEITAIIGEHVGLMASDPNFATDIETIDGRRKIAERLWEIGSKTFQASLVLGSVGTGMDVAHRMRMMQRAETDQRFFTDVANGVSAVKLKDRAPDKLAGFLATTFGDGDRATVYVTRDGFVSAMNKANVSLAEIAEIIPDIEQQLNESGESGHIAFPTAVWASRIVGTQFDNELRQHIKGNPNAPSLAQLPEYRAQVDEMMRVAEQEMAERLEVDEQFAAQRQTVEDNLTQQAVVAGRPEEEARTWARGVSRFFAMIATEENRSIEEVFAATPYAVRGMQPAGVAPAVPSVAAPAAAQPQMQFAGRDAVRAAVPKLSAAAAMFSTRVTNENLPESNPRMAARLDIVDSVAALRRAVDKSDDAAIAGRVQDLQAALDTHRSVMDGKTVRDIETALERVSAATQQPAMAAMAQPSGVLEQAPAGIPNWALATAPVTVTPAMKKEAIANAPKASQAQRNYDKIDALFAKYPNPLASADAWREWMAALTGSAEVLDVPEVALKYANDPMAVAEYLRNLRPDQLASRRAGFALGKKIREQYANGTADARITGRLLLWAILSRKAGAYPHESAYMDLVNAGVDKWIDKAVSGDWTEQDGDEYVKWCLEFMETRKGGVSPGAGVTSNANDYGRILLSKMSERDEATGKTGLQRLHEVIADNTKTTNDVRRAFFALGDSVGIQNKVLSFALLVTGRWDTLVLDRVQFTHLWGPGYQERAGYSNIYDGREGGLIRAGEGHYGMAIYEALARGMTDSIREGYKLAGLTGDGDGTLGAFHWDSWLIESSQAIGHPTIEALTGPAPRPDLAVRQGKFDTFAYNFEYRADGQYQIPLLDGSGYRVMSPAEAAAFMDRLRDPKEQVVPKNFKVSEYDTIPWVDAQGVNRARYDAILNEYGRSVDAADVAPAGSADARRPVPSGAAAGKFEQRPPARDGGRRRTDGTLAPLPGAPIVEGATGPDAGLNAVAERYAASIGIPMRRQAEYAVVDPARGARIAAAYDAMQHAPQDPVVREAYANLIQQTIAQYRALEAAGYRFWFFDDTTDPYDGKPWRAMRDLRNNKSMGVYSSEAGFGSGATDLNVEDNPLLADTGIMWPFGSPDGPMRRVLANDLFRAVHDAFGHGLEGAGFRADGEENAWQAHARLFTGSAIAALTSETRGQNSWLNFGPYGAQNQTAGTLETVFADQKTGLMPEWTWQEGVVSDESSEQVFNQSQRQAVLFSALRRELAGIDTKPLTADSWNQRLKALISAGKIKEQELLWSGLQEWLAMQSGKVSKEQVQGFLDGNGVRVEVITRTNNDVALTAALEAELAADDAAVIQQMRNDMAALEYEPVVLNARLMYRDTGTGDIMDDYAVSRALEQRFGGNHASIRKFAVASSLLDSAFGNVMNRMSPLHGGYVEEGGSNFRNILVTAPGESFIPKDVATRLDAQQADINARIDAAESDYREQLWPLRDNSEQLNKELRDNQEARLQLLRANAPKPIDSYSKSMAPSLATYGEEELRVLLEAMLKFDEGSIEKYVALQKDIDRIMRARNDADVAIRAFRDKFYNEHLAELYEDREQIGRQLTTPNFVNQAHFYEPNILGHALVDDRIGADGKLALGVREMQSDWGQDARDGFAPTPQELAERRRNVREVDTHYPRIIEMMTDYLSRGGIADAKVAAVNLWWDVVAKINDGKTVKPLTDATDEDNAFIVRIAKLQVQNEQNDPNAKSGVPRAPFVHSTDAWVTLLLKQMLIEAVNNNYDRIVISNGKDVASHYGGMSKRQKEGTRVFYDEVVPAAANKLLKRLGASPVTKSDVRGSHRDMNEAFLVDQTTIEITPELREKILGEGLPLYQARRQQPLGTFDPRTLTTMLLQGANASTLIHETGHMYLTVLSQLAMQPNASERIRGDIDTVLNWFGIAGATPEKRLQNWNGMTLEQQRPFHEQFAYNYELYWAEGKAPSVELQGVFDRFAKWLKEVYNDIRTNINEIYRQEFGRDLPILTPEVKQVFDRLLATDRQIERAQQVRAMRPLFLTQEESGMSDAEWAAFKQMDQEAKDAAITDLNAASMRQMQWLSNARMRVLKDMQRKHDALREDIREEEREKVRAMPLYRAMQFLRTGVVIDIDGSERKLEGVTKFNREAIDKMYELDPPALRPDMRRLSKWYAEDGIHPDLIAERFGFSSGDSLIRAILDAKPLEQEVTERTDARMLAEHGEMNTKEAQEEAIEVALHNEARARFVGVELRFLSKITTPVQVMVEAARSAARTLIGKKRIMDLRPSDYVAAETKAAQMAESVQEVKINPERAAKAAYTRAYNDQASAVAAGLSESQRVAVATAKANQARQAAEQRLNAFVEKYGKLPPAEIAILSKREQLLNNQLAAEALAARREVEDGLKYLRKVTSDANRKRMGADYGDQIDAMLERFDLATMSRARLAERASLTAWLEAKRAEGLDPDIDPMLENEAMRKPYQQMTIDEFRALVEAVTQIEYMGKNQTKILLANEKREFNETRDELTASVEENARGKKGVTRTQTTLAGKAAAKRRTFLAGHIKIAAFARVLDGNKDNGPVWRFFIRTSNELNEQEVQRRAEATETLAEIMKPFLGAFTSVAKQFPSINRSLTKEEVVALALNWGNSGNRQRLLDGEGWTEAQVLPVLQSLTLEEWQAIQKIWDYINTFRPEVNAVHRRLYGRDMNMVEPAPFAVRTSDGKVANLTGGYYPAKYDPLASAMGGSIDAVQEAKQQLQAAYGAPTARDTFQRKRAAKVVNKPILLSLSALFGHVDEVIHYVTWAEWLISTNRMLRSESFTRAVREFYGPEVIAEMKQWVNDIAGGDRAAQTAGDIAARWLRKSISQSRLGFNIINAIQQISGLSASVVRVGAKHMALAVADFAANPRRTYRMVNEKSQFMRNRGRTQFRELAELRNTLERKNPVANATDSMRANAYIFTVAMQRIVDMPTWMGAYNKALENGEEEQTAITLADQAVIDSQGSGTINNLSRVERSSEGHKLFTLFYSWQSTMLNMGYVEAKTQRNMAKLAMNMAILYMTPVVMNVAIKRALMPSRGEGDDDNWLAQLAKDLTAEQLSMLLGMFVYVRELSNLPRVAMGGSASYSGPSGTAPIVDLYSLTTQVRQGEPDAAARRALINVLGDATGVPSVQINRMIDGLSDLSNEKTSNPLAPIVGTRK